MHKKLLGSTYLITILFLTLLLLDGCSTAKKKPVALSIPVKQEVALSMPVKQEVVKPEKRMGANKGILVKKEIKKKITGDVLVFRDLEQIDLNHDGTKAIVAVYTTKSNLGAVKVIKIIDEKTGEIIFKQTFNTTNIKFRMSKGKSLILVKEKDYLFGWGMNSVYQWDGKNFIFIRKTISL